MINIEIKLENLKIDYPNFFNFFKDTLSHSQSKFKDYKESKYNCYYYIGFYMLTSQKTDEYYHKLITLKWEDRKKEEYKKAKITITMVVGKFVLSDQTTEISENIKPYLDEIIARKIYGEQMSIGEPNEEIVNSIPNVDEIIEKIENEQKDNQEMLEKMGLNVKDFVKGGGTTTLETKEISTQEMLNQLIQNEDYEKAEELIKNYPELKKRDE